MTLGIPPAVLERRPAPTARINRRVNVRYPSGAATTTAVGSSASPLLRRVRVWDVSQGGIAFILRKPLDVGQNVYIQITNRILNFTFDLAAEVRHVTKHTRGRWLVGLQFDRELTMAELASVI